MPGRRVRMKRPPTRMADGAKLAETAQRK